MINYKKFMFPVIVAGLMIAHLPAQAISAKEMLSMMQQGTYKFCQPFFKTMWGVGAKFINTAFKEQPKATAFFTGTATIAGAGIFKYISLWKKNAQLLTANTKLLAEKESLEKEQRERDLALEKERHENYLALKKQQAKDSVRFYEQYKEMNEQLKEEAKVMEAKVISNAISQASNEIKNARLEKDKEIKVGLNAAAIEIANGIGGYFAALAKKEDQHEVEPFKSKNPLIKETTNGTIGAILLNNLQLFSENYKQTAEANTKARIAKETQRDKQTIKELGEIIKNLRDGVKEQFIKKNEALNKLELFKDKNKKLNGQNEQNGKNEALNEIEKLNGQNGMKKSLSFEDLKFEDLRKKDTITVKLLDKSPVIEEKNNQLNGTLSSLNNVSTLTSSDFDFVYHKLKPDQEQNAHFINNENKNNELEKTIN